MNGERHPKKKSLITSGELGVGLIFLMIVGCSFQESLGNFFKQFQLGKINSVLTISARKIVVP
nr:MAG TPA: hypothetical protein [Caudoviricetes sp.]